MLTGHLGVYVYGGQLQMNMIYPWTSHRDAMELILNGEYHGLALFSSIESMLKILPSNIAITPFNSKLPWALHLYLNFVITVMVLNGPSNLILYKMLQTKIKPMLILLQKTNYTSNLNEVPSLYLLSKPY